MAAQWSELRRELLELILEKLDLVDHARFASVCSWWRSVAVENPPINKPLYFAVSHDPENLVRRFITSFVVPSWDVCWFVGALDGWVVILADDLNLFLLNKGFNSIIPLPPLPKVPNRFRQSPEIRKAVLSSTPSSSGECTVVIKHVSAGLFYCRLGSDKSFTELSEVPPFPEDILFYKGRLYVLCYVNEVNTITIFDHLLKRVTELFADFGEGRHHGRGNYRLLISENKLLITVGHFDPVSVFEFEESESRVVRVENMNDNLLLLVNSFCSLSVTTNKHKEFRTAANFLKLANFLKFVYNCTVVLDASEDSGKAKVGDPWPLFFVMFRVFGIKRLYSWSAGTDRNVVW